MRPVRGLALSVVVAGACAQAPRERGFAHCSPPTSGVDLQTALSGYTQLEAWCMVDTDASGQLIFQPQALPYALTTPLFSDYAEKTRTVWLPPGATVPYDADSWLDFPVGTIISKTFAFAADERTPGVDVTLIETRILSRDPSEWTALTYEWDAAGREATLNIAGALHDVSFIAPSGETKQAKYLLPTQTQCAQCHESNKVLHPIGPKARLLNRDFNYPDGSTENQLAKWSAAGLLTGAPDPAAAPAQVAWDDTSAPVDARARAWLEVNCAHCHSDDGLARTTGLFLWASVTDPTTFGVCKPPVATGPASGGLRYDIVPGQPDQSILVYRISSTTPAIMMPEIGRSLAHDEGVALIRMWISGLTGSCK
jgi:uncharacterized repeat protein (TIGR03806 family)